MMTFSANMVMDEDGNHEITIFIIMQANFLSIRIRKSLKLNELIKYSDVCNVLSADLFAK